jgi:hypothetical protein
MNSNQVIGQTTPDFIAEDDLVTGSIRPVLRTPAYTVPRSAPSGFEPIELAWIWRAPLASSHGSSVVLSCGCWNELKRGPIRLRI